MTSGKTAVVLGGRTGLLGQALCHVLQEQGWTVSCPDREELDLLQSDAVSRYLDKRSTDVLYNTVGYTQVDKAEEERDKAYLLNRQLPSRLGIAAKKTGCGLVHYSTDFVFDGRKDVPYAPEDEPNPQCEYGKSKLAGERALLDMDLDSLCIIRTAWLFGPYKTNFVDKILSYAREREVLRVVHDQVGSPTYTPDLAHHSVQLVEAGGQGIFHIVNSGKASWCELAAEAVSFAGETCQVQAITSKEYPQKAKRPAYSVLDVAKFQRFTGVSPRPWLSALRDYCFQKES